MVLLKTEKVDSKMKHINEKQLYFFKIEDGLRNACPFCFSSTLTSEGCLRRSDRMILKACLF